MSALFMQLVFAVGGGLGAVARHALSEFLPHRFPLATLLVNVTGSFLLGASIAVLTKDATVLSPQEAQLVFGFCGGFTTFSSFAYQNLQLHRSYTVLHVACNITLSLVLCILAFGAGVALF